jgi:streptogramin lyase
MKLSIVSRFGLVGAPFAGSPPFLQHSFPAVCLSLSLIAMLGCGATSIPSTSPAPGVAMAGGVFGGEQPVVGAKIYLYAAGATGNGSPSTSLLSTSASGVGTDSSGNGYVLTDADGNFAITGDWSCVNPSDQVYLVALGGNPGLAPGVSNEALGLMSGLGTCGSLVSTYPYIDINEVTTVATVWALQQFLSDARHVGSSPTNALGLANAFAQITNIVNPGTGVARAATPAGNGAVPQAKINTIANILATCVSSAGVGSATCSSLFAAASAAGKPAVADTIMASLQMARKPGSNVSQFFDLVNPMGPFQPQLSAAPNDWMLPINFTGGGLNGPASVGVDGLGNLWVADYSGAASSFSPLGVPIATSGYTGIGLRQPLGLAIDQNNNVWLANEQSTGSINHGLGDITELDPNGNLLSGSTGYANGGIYFPMSVTADPNGNMWVVDYGDSKVTLLNSSGVALSGTGGWGGASLQFPVALAVDSHHNAWVADQSSTSITEIAADGSSATSIACCNGASGIATDQSDNVWVANYYGDSISEVSSAGLVLLNGVVGGGLHHPLGIAIDGAGTVWVANYRGGSISQLDGANSSSPGTVRSPANGFGVDSALLEPYGIAIDASGNAWVTSFGNATLTEFLGIASPIRTPLAGPPATP